MKKENSKNEKGITMITLAMAIVIMLIISSVLIYNAKTGATTRRLNNMYQDIKLLSDKVSIYYSQYGKLPTLEPQYTQIGDITDKNSNDNAIYLVIDLEAMDNLTLSYGKGYTDFKSDSKENKDLYIINQKSHIIYYVAGIVLDGKNYYTVPIEHTKVELPIIAKVEMQEKKGNTATLLVQGADRENGIQSINVYVGNQRYKSFLYEKDKLELKKEIIEIQPLTFNEEIQVHIEITNQSGTNTISNTITLKNEDTIANKEDLIKFATLVNAGTTFEDKTIYIMNTIELEGNQTDPWTPIGTDSNNFLGTFEGNGNKISGIYINNTKNYQGLFYRNQGTIQNLTVAGTITAGGYSGGIAGENNKVIQRCINEVNIYSDTGVCIGGITGQNMQYAVLKECYNTGTIIGKAQDSYGHSFCGGITGTNQGELRTSYNKGKIEGIQTVGGIAGGHYQGILEDCYNLAEVKGNIYIGGIVGALHFTSGHVYDYSIVRNTYNIGIIANIPSSGGIVGSITNVTGVASNNYYLTATATGGINSADVIENAEVKTEVELKEISAKLGTSFKKDTQNINGGYPIFTWQ